MKSKYTKPEVQVVSLLPRDGLLITGSNQGYAVDPFTPGLSSFDSGYSFYEGE